MRIIRAVSAGALGALCLQLIPLADAQGFSDVRSGITPYSQAILSLQENGVIEGYEDGSFKPTATINRAEFLKIILEARGGELSGSNCFPDVRNEWFAPYVCTAKTEEIIAGYPDGTFRPAQPITFPEASKILSLAYGQSIEDYSPDWYEPYVRALESSKAIPLSVEKLEQQIDRGEMAEMMWRLSEGISDQPSKGYLNVKYPEVSINLASDKPQQAKSCSDLKAFAEEAARSGNYGFGAVDDMVGMPVMMQNTAADTAESARAPAPSANKSYAETNVQVAGVDEADIIKTDGTYLYIVQDGKIRIVLAHPAEQMDLIGTIDLSAESFSPRELYIDGDRLIVLGSSWYTPYSNGMKRSFAPSLYGGQQTAVHIFDVSDRTNPELVRSVSFDGNQVSSRRIGGKLYLVMNQWISWYGPGPVPVPLEADILPKFRDSAIGTADVPVARCGDVVILPHIPQPEYLIVAAIPTDGSASPVEREVVMGSAQNIYSSLDNLYIAATHYRYNWRGPVSTSEERTSVYRFAYTDDGIDLKAHGTVPGRILNQFSMDEYESSFRIATTRGNNWDTSNPATNNLYVLNMEMEQVGAIEDIAPGEQIYSVRFMGDRTYMVTFKKVDPFFVIDTSNPRNPTILGKLKIPGYSDYLHPYDDTHIIGFGKDAVAAKEGDFAWYQGMKMAIFDVTDPGNPTEMYKFGIGDRGTDSPLLQNHKALLFDKERNLLAFPVSVSALTDAQKQGDPGSAWGETVFQGAYVFSVDLQRGFQLRGTISHYDDEDMLKAGSYLYGKNIERITRIEDSLYTISSVGVQSHTERTVEYENGLTYDRYSAGQCPDEDAAGVTYASHDPETCAVLRFFCEDGQEAFSNSCGCGCVPVK